MVKYEVVAWRDDDGQQCWRVVVDGRFTTPQFNSKGAAQAYVGVLKSGARKPEFRS